MKLLLFSSFLYLLNTITVNGQNETERYNSTTGKLLFLHTLWRHGTRAPHEIYPTSIYNETTYYPGLSELLVQGMTEHFLLGQKLGQRYITQMNLISKSPDISEVYVRSSDYNRTIMSAICNFYGFYSSSAVEGSNYPKNSQWPRGFMPVPVHTVPLNTDALFNLFDSCPVQIQLQNLQMETPEYKALEENYTDVFEYLEEKSGMNTSTIGGKMSIADALDCEQSLGLQMTDWGKASLPAASKFISTFLNRAAGMGVEDYKNISLGQELAKVTGGPLLTEIINRMNDKFENYLNSTVSSWIQNLKYYAYSGHDTSILSLFSTFGIERSDVTSDDVILPSSTVCVELWVDSNNNTDVKVLYLRRNSTSFLDITSYITGCEDGCSLEQFTDRSSPYIWDTPDFCSHEYDVPQ